MSQHPSSTRHARFPQFYQHSVAKRLQLLHEQGFLSSADVELLGYGQQVLKNSQADKMIENVIGVFGLPLAVALNFNINEQAYVVPLVVEEPSIVAALSSAAKLLGISGGFTVTSANPLLIGQIQVVNISHPTQAKNALFNAREAILDLANSLHPNMVARGGGARDIEVHLHPLRDQHGDMLVVHLLVDTCDAMGANVVNTMCESVAALIEQITGGKVFLRILSNLTDRAMVHARAEVAPADLTTASHPGTQVRDGIVLANDFAVVDPYRAATHNKGMRSMPWPLNPRK